MKKEVFIYKNRKLKKRFVSNLGLKKLNYINYIKYNYFIYFLYSENLILNRKILVYFVSTENGSLFSLKKWFEFKFYKFY
uniref:ribosomal protein L20 n=1 Tax=Cystoclonium purpureum f. stellatum TaxID=3024809 RepID=UPI0023F3ACF5|nr:ribosomal protein L20 [Cystoclonium purpureum f. stellatum]WDY85173.1 ribosomal protein L20 [Cystoclonium purpureum f. stellatum]